MSNAAASAIRDGPIRPAIVFEFAMDCLPARCRCSTSTDKNTHREEPVRRSAATGPTPAISRRERAENAHLLAPLRASDLSRPAKRHLRRWRASLAVAPKERRSVARADDVPIGVAGKYSGRTDEPPLRVIIRRSVLESIDLDDCERRPVLRRRLE